MGFDENIAEKIKDIMNPNKKITKDFVKILAFIDTNQNNYFM